MSTWIIIGAAWGGMAKVSKQIQRLFLRLLNFTPDLLVKIQKEAEVRNTSFDAVVRAAVEQFLKAASGRKQEEAEFEECARMRLRAHFAEDRNEFLTEDNIRIIGR